MASGADRLSALPDELLHHVLATSGNPPPPCASRASGPTTTPRGTFASSSLDSLELDLDGRGIIVKPLPYRTRSVNLWFRLALLCKARVLSLRTTSDLYDNEDEEGFRPLKLLNVPIISQHLQKLDLRLVDLKSSTLDFSGCPTLIDLRMKICGLLGNISSPFLKRLSADACYFANGSLRTRVYLPGLVSLELSYFSGRTPMLGNMPLLVSAIVRVGTYCYDNCPNDIYGDCDDRICSGCYDYDNEDGRGESMLLQGLSQVTELELSVDSKVGALDLKLCPTFPKLKMLLLSEWCPSIAADLNVLTCFLQHSPILEKLTLQLSKVDKDKIEAERSYARLEQSVLFSHLKIVEIKCDEADGSIHEILDIFCASIFKS
ncbi:hypothetical protein ACP70R_003828 [Stipagrostis hirtigluma subsp. patula]